jgi:hypothetical protein
MASDSLVSRVRGRLRLIYLAPVLALIALLAWSLASPVGSSPDDDYHLNSIWCASQASADDCQPGSGEANREVLQLTEKSPCYAQQPEKSAACLDVYAQDPTTTVDSHRGNFLGQYPPVFYATMSVFVGPDVILSAYVMRVVNVVLFLAISTALALLLPVGRRMPLIGGWLITTIPLAAFLLPSTNPSAWAIIGVPSAWIALVGYFESTGRRKVALGAIFAVTVVMAAGARVDAAIYTILASALAIWMTFRRERVYLLSAILPVVLAVVAVLFYLSSGQTSVATGGLTDSDDRLNPPDDTNAPKDLFGLIAYNLLQMPQLWAGVFGLAGLGWLDTTLPAIVWAGSGAVFVAVAFSGIRQLDWRKAVAVIGVALVAWLLPTYVLVVGGNIVGQNVQPRYILPIIIILGMLVLVPVGTQLYRFTWLQLSFIGFALVVANSFALHTDIRRYVTGIDVAAAILDAGAEWWWAVGPSPMATWVIGTLAYAGLVAVLGREVVKRGLLADGKRD